MRRRLSVTASLAALALAGAVHAQSLTLLGVSQNGAAAGGGGGGSAPFVILADPGTSQTAGSTLNTTNTTASCPANSTVLLLGNTGQLGGPALSGVSDSSGLGLTWTIDSRSMQFTGLAASVHLGASPLPSGTHFTITLGGTGSRVEMNAICFPSGAGVAEMNSSGGTHNNSNYGGHSSPITITAGTFASPPEWQIGQVLTLHGSVVNVPGSWVHMTGGDIVSGVVDDSGYTNATSQLFIQPATATSSASSPPGFSVTLNSDDNWYAQDAYVPSH